MRVSAKKLIKIMELEKVEMLKASMDWFARFLDANVLNFASAKVERSMIAN